MLAEVRLLIAPREIRLLLRRGDDVVEDELWKPDRPVSLTEAKALAKAAFDTYFDLVNHAVHGD